MNDYYENHETKDSLKMQDCPIYKDRDEVESLHEEVNKQDDRIKELESANEKGFVHQVQLEAKLKEEREKIVGLRMMSINQRERISNLEEGVRDVISCLEAGISIPHSTRISLKSLMGLKNGSK